MVKKFKPNITRRHSFRFLIWNVLFRFVNLDSNASINYQLDAIDFLLVNVVRKVFPTKDADLDSFNNHKLIFNRFY